MLQKMRSCKKNEELTESEIGYGFGVIADMSLFEGFGGLKIRNYL